jgi:transketolase N-terminal domain/subunit
MGNLKEIATQIRRDIVRMVHAVQSGHPGGSLGCTEYFSESIKFFNGEISTTGKGTVKNR